MKYFFSEIDEITLTFGDIHFNSYGMEYIRIYFERPNDSGFDFLESNLPALEIKKSSGFNDKEIKKCSVRNGGVFLLSFQNIFQRLPRVGIFNLRDVFRRTKCNNFAASVSAVRAQVNYIICVFDNV